MKMLLEEKGKRGITLNGIAAAQLLYSEALAFSIEPPHLKPKLLSLLLISAGAKGKVFWL